MKLQQGLMEDPRSSKEQPLSFLKSGQTLFWTQNKLVIELLKHGHFFNKFTNFGLLQQSQGKILTLRFLLYIVVLLYALFWYLVDRTVHFHYCITLPIIPTVWKKVDCNVNFHYCTGLPVIRTRPVTFISTALIIHT